MAGFGPSGDDDLTSVVDGPPGLAKGPRLTLGQLMKAMALFAVLLAIVVQAYDLFVLLTFVSTFVVLAACGYGVSRLSYGIRLTIELATACSLLALSAWVWRPPFYGLQADTCNELAELCARLAVNSDDVQMADRFRREVAEYNHMARTLRMRGMWAGLIRSFTKAHPGRISEQDMIFAFQLRRAEEAHLRIARKMGLIQYGPSWW